MAIYSTSISGSKDLQATLAQRVAETKISGTDAGATAFGGGIGNPMADSFERAATSPFQVAAHKGIGLGQGWSLGRAGGRIGDFAANPGIGTAVDAAINVAGAAANFGAFGPYSGAVRAGTTAWNAGNFVNNHWPGGNEPTNPSSGATGSWDSPEFDNFVSNFVGGGGLSGGAGATGSWSLDLGLDTPEPPSPYEENLDNLDYLNHPENETESGGDQELAPNNPDNNWGYEGEFDGLGASGGPNGNQDSGDGGGEANGGEANGGDSSGGSSSGGSNSGFGGDGGGWAAL